MNTKSNLFLKATLLILVSSLAASTAWGQTEEQFDPHETLSVNTRLVNVTVTATGAGGRARSFNTEALKLYADGIEQEMAYLHSEEAASNVVLLVDVSESMRGPAAETTRFLVSEFLKASDARNQYTLFVFNNVVKKVGEYGGDADGRRQLLEDLRKEKYRGGTALYSAARATLKQALAAKRSYKTALVIFTDGLDNASAGNQLADDLDSFGGFSCAFVIGPSTSADMLGSIYNPIPKSETERIAAAAKKYIGGEAYVARGLDRNFEKVAKRVAEIMHYSVEVGFYPQDNAAQPGPHTIQVASTAGGDLKLRSRLRYVIEK